MPDEYANTVVANLEAFEQASRERVVQNLEQKQSGARRKVEHREADVAEAERNLRVARAHLVECDNLLEMAIAVATPEAREAYVRGKVDREFHRAVAAETPEQKRRAEYATQLYQEQCANMTTPMMIERAMEVEGFESERLVCKAVNCLIAFTIADPAEICENTLDILDPGWRVEPTGDDLVDKVTERVSRWPDWKKRAARKGLLSED